MMSAFKDRNQTSEALIEKFGLSTKEPNVTRLIPFSSKRKFRAVSLAKLGTFAIGAPEFVLSKRLCRN